MAVRGTPFPIRHSPDICPPKDDCLYRPYPILSVLPLFPGLQLDTLTVYDAYHGEGVCEDIWGHDHAYQEFEDFVKIDKGFKELVYISTIDRFLNTNYLGKKKAPQPCTWDKMIKDRDGADSGAAVEMFTFGDGQRTRLVGDHPYYHTRRDRRIVFADDNRDGEYAISLVNKIHGGAQHGHKDDMWQEVIEGDLEVRVRRGKNADYVQDGKSAHEWDDELHVIFAKLSWKEIKEQGLLMPGAEDDPTAHL